MSYDGFISYSHAADDLLAPRLQAGLQRFAKPWWQRRALRIFRDESSLAANPHLWSSITDALDEAGWFVLLLSPDAAQSEWVNQEIAYWLEHREADRIIPVVTSGEFGWDGSDVAGDCVPEALRGVFADEPRWVDARELGDPETLDLQNPEFAAVVADLAAPLRGVPKDELASEEIRQHKRTVRTAWSAGVVVLVLAVAAAGFGIQSSRNAAEAERQAGIAAANESEAESQRQAAETNAAEAERQADAAEEQRQAAVDAAELARARELGAFATEAVEADPRLAQLLALEAVDTLGPDAEQPSFVLNALWTSLLADRLAAEVETGLPGYTVMDASQDGSTAVVVASEALAAQFHELPDLTPLGTVTIEDAQQLGVAALSPDGAVAAISFWRDPGDGGSGIRIAATDGSVIDAIDYPDCATVDAWSWSGDAGLLAVTNGFEPCPREGAEGGAWVELIDTTTWESIAVLPSADPLAAQAHFDDAGRLFVLGPLTPTAVYDVGTVAQTTVLDEATVGLGAIAPDGSYVATWTNVLSSDSGTLGVRLADVAAGARVDVFEPASSRVSEPLGIAFSPDGRFVAAATNGNVTSVWDVASGFEAFALPSGAADSVVFGADGRWLYTTHPDGTVRRWDLGPISVNTTEAGDLGRFGFVNANSFGFGPDFGAAQTFDTNTFESVIQLFDLETGQLAGTTYPGFQHQPLPDGTLARSDESRNWIRTDPTTDESEVMFVCEPAGDPECTHVDGLLIDEVWLSADGTEVGLRGVSRDREALYSYDPATGENVVVAEVSGSRLAGFGPGWVAAFADNDFVVTDRSTGEETLRIPVLWDRWELSPSGRSFAIFGGSEVTVVDMGALTHTYYRPDVGGVRALSFDPEETTLALGDEDRLHFLDLETGLVTQSIPIPGISDAHWLSDDEVVVGSNQGLWATISLSVDDLIEVARDRPVPRTFTTEECATFSIDPCPADG